MRLTHHADLSLRLLMHLALTGQERVTIEQISNAFAVSRNHLMKVANRLATLGYVDSMRGSGGGLMLGQPAKDIRVGAVVRDMEPDFGLVECFRPENQCVITPVCVLPHMLQEALDAFLAVLDRYTLADLITPKIASEMTDILKIRVQ